jgi:hypothetical protein
VEVGVAANGRSRLWVPRRQEGGHAAQEPAQAGRRHASTVPVA